MENSILLSTLKMLGLPYDEEFFHYDILVHINGVLATLRQIGCGNGSITFISGPKDTWDKFLGDDMDILPLVKNYVYFRVKVMFDPSSSSTLLESTKNLADQMQFRIQNACELKHMTLTNG